MSAFAGTGLLTELAGRGISQVVLAGVSRHLVVVATAFAASDAGLDVEVLALTAPSPAKVAGYSLAWWRVRGFRWIQGCPPCGGRRYPRPAASR